MSYNLTNFSFEDDGSPDIQVDLPDLLLHFSYLSEDGVSFDRSDGMRLAEFFAVWPREHKVAFLRRIITDVIELTVYYSQQGEGG